MKPKSLQDPHHVALVTMSCSPPAYVHFSLLGLLVQEPHSPQARSLPHNCALCLIHPSPTLPPDSTHPSGCRFHSTEEVFAGTNEVINSHACPHQTTHLSQHQLLLFNLSPLDRKLETETMIFLSPAMYTVLLHIFC